MNDISITWDGDGYAYCDNYFPNDGDTVTLTCVPDAHCTLLNIVATDEHGYYVALLVTEVQQFTYHSILGHVDIHVSFSVTPWVYRYLWLIAKVSQDWRHR